MNIKSIILLASVGLLGFFACTSDDDEVNPGFEVNFKDQDLQGKINDSTFLYTDGLATSTGNTQGFLHKFVILDTLVDSTTCTSVLDTTREVIFSYLDTNALVIPGRTNLFFDPLGSANSNVTVKFFYWYFDEMDSVLKREQVTVSEGAYEILSVDTSTNVIEGRMHIRENAKNLVNGNFTLKYCSY